MNTLLAILLQVLDVNRLFYINMQSRPWILVLALITTFLALITYHGWTLFKANERIKNYLINYIRPILGEKCDIEYLDMAVGAVHLKGVHIESKDSTYILDVDDLRIGYNIVNLIKYGFKPQKSPQDILFVNPSLTVRYTSPNGKRNTLSYTNSYHDYLNKVKDFSFLKRITISKGSIVYEDSLQKKTILANDISGWISTRDIEKAEARLVGKLFHSSKLNLRLDGQINLLKEKLDFLKVNLINFKWKERVPFFIPDYLDIQQGIINGDFMITEKAKTKGFDIDGKLLIEDGAIKIQNKNLIIQNINLEADVVNWDLIIKKSQQDFNGSNITVEGKIINIFAPEFYLNLHSKSFDIQKFQTYFAPNFNLKFAGNSTLMLSIHNSYQSPLIKGFLDCPQLSIGKNIIDNVKLNISFHESILSIAKLTSNYHSLNINGGGSINFGLPEGNIQFEMMVKGVLPDKFQIQNFKSLAASNCHTNLKLSGNFEKLIGEASLLLNPQFNDSLSFSFLNTFTLSGNNLIFTIVDNQENKYVSGAIIFKEDENIFNVKLTNVHRLLYQLPEFQSIKNIFNFGYSDTEIISQTSKTRIMSKFTWKEGKEEEARFGNLEINVKNERLKKRISAKLSCKFGNQDYNGTAQIVKELDVIHIHKIQFDDILFASGTINQGNSKEIEGKIIFNRSDLNHIYNIFNLNSPFISQGKLNGSINIRGLIESPHLDGQLEFDDLYLNDVGIYYGSLIFERLGNKIAFNQIFLEHNDNLIFEGLGEYTLLDKKLNFNFKGNQIELDNIVQSLTTNKDLISGTAEVDLRLGGSINDLELQGDIRVGKCKFYKFQFDSIYARLGDQAESRLPRSIGLNISQLFINRNDQFQIQGNGKIPLTTRDSIDINLFGAGNLLSILTEITPFFIKTASVGNWEINVTGSPGNFNIKSGSINLEQGYLRLGAVAPEIKDISANISIESDGFVKIEHINGKIKGRSFTFRNERSEKVCSREHFVSFNIEELGLDFGILFLETINKGVPLHIPGLMAKGEIGYFEFFGRDSCEQFYFAGPISNPLVRGNIRLRNANLMYPFAEAPGMAESPVVKLLQAIRWNVNAIPGKDTRYEKEIPSGVDKVYVNLSIDNGVGGLDFGGIIDEETFYIDGELESTGGTVDYLDFDFRIEKAGLEFDKSDLLPIVYGKAKAIIPDSLGVPNNIYLTLMLEDEQSGHILTKGRWGKILFKISADNPILGMTEGEILTSLGYSASNIKERATDIIGISTDNFLFRPLFRPFERQLERTLNLDLVRFSSRFTRNLIEMNLWREDFVNNNSKLYLLRSTRLMVGKHLADKLFVSYTGQLESNMNFRSHEQQLGLKHSLGLEFRINSNLLLEMEYNYNSFLLVPEDKRIFLRHSFPIH